MHSTPAVAGNLVIVASCNGMIRALDSASGHLMWEYDTDQSAESSFHGDPLLVDNLIMLGTDGRSDDGIYALDQTTGRLMWKARVPTTDSDILGIATDIQSFHGRVYATSLADELMCLRSQDGAPMWSHRSGYRPKEWLLNGTPAIVGEALYFGGLDGTAYALASDDGKLLWAQHLGDSIRTSACVVESGIVMGTTDGNLHLLDRQDGSVKKQLSMGKSPSGPIMAANGKLFVCTDWLRPGSELMCTDDTLSRVIWAQKPPEGTVWSAPRPYIYDGRVFVGNTGGTVFEYRFTDGQLVQQTQIGGVIRGIRLVDDVLFVGDQDGTVYAIKR